MCGIAVILKGSAVEAPPFAIDRMTASLSHRGPDAQAVLRLPECHLGHTRLSVIDLEGGQQPMTADGGRFSLVFNGEIYNYRALRRELEADGCAFRTHSDTEVLLLGFALWGSGIVPRLNGQFAFAVWDATNQTLFAARDRFGEKPLYFARTPGGQILLASEIKSILASGLLSPRIDPVSVDAYLGLFYVPPDRTIYQNIHTLPPAHTLTVTHLAVEQSRYWQPSFSCHDVDETQAVREIRTFISAAVDRQRVADVPIGAFLSGGLDSTTIVAEMAHQSSNPIKTFSAGFGDLIDELPFARQVASMYQTDHRELQMNIDVPAMLDAMMDVYDEPFADSSNIPTWLLAARAREEVKVVLSGDGGDEIFGGYAWYTNLLQPRSTPGIDPFEQHLGSATGLLFDRSALWGANPPPAAQSMRERYRPSDRVRGIDRACSFDIASYLPGDILVKVDRAAMAHGLEVRSPFLDVELSDFVLGLPSELRFGPGGLKRLLRLACGELWPQSIRTREKQGFGAPVRHWIEQPGVVDMWQRVTRLDAPLLALLPGVGKVAAELRPQRKWSLLCLGLWLERRSECLGNQP